MVWLGNENYSIYMQNSGQAYYKAYFGHQFFTYGVERLKIASGGNVLIGTTTDNGSKLQVESASSTYEVATFKGSVHSGLGIKAGEGYNPFIRFGAHSTYKAELGFSANLGNIYIGSYNTELGFLNINLSSGNVLIGTTTDNGYKLQVNGSERVYGDLIVDGEVSALVA